MPMLDMTIKKPAPQVKPEIIPQKNMPLDIFSQCQKDLFEERAGIIEFEGLIQRQEAEQTAFEIVRQTMSPAQIFIVYNLGGRVV